MLDASILHVHLHAYVCKSYVRLLRDKRVFSTQKCQVVRPMAIYRRAHDAISRTFKNAGFRYPLVQSAKYPVAQPDKFDIHLCKGINICLQKWIIVGVEKTKKRKQNKQTNKNIPIDLKTVTSFVQKILHNYFLNRFHNSKLSFSIHTPKSFDSKPELGA